MKYIVHAVFSTDDGSGSNLVVWENMYLIYANSIEEVELKTINICKKDEASSQNNYLDGKKAIYIFKGIRKIIKLSFSEYDDDLYDGRELTYNKYEVDNINIIDDMVDGKTVTIRIEPD
ncbi:MAG: hypothetical protein SFY80_05905 [Verrucomicrobiota bacterium]|nr:hypothetical protein [Verrucomicrobiota bacterium]